MRAQVYRQDYASELFFKSHPDPAGNLCSPVATVFQSASFISSLEELALQAEVVRARQLLVTQPAIRTHTNQNLDPSNLFFDSESRAVQASASADEDTAQAQQLATTAKLMAVINRMQTTDQSGRERPAASGGVTHVPPPMPPQLFTCPERQQVVPGVRPPEARSDLVDLMRVVRACQRLSSARAQKRLGVYHALPAHVQVNDHIAAAMGVSVPTFQTSRLRLRAHRSPCAVAGAGERHRARATPFSNRTTPSLFEARADTPIS